MNYVLIIALNNIVWVKINDIMSSQNVWKKIQILMSPFASILNLPHSMFVIFKLSKILYSKLDAYR